MSQPSPLTPALQSNIAVVAQYDFLLGTQQEPEYGVYEGRLFICSQKTNTWFQHISQIFYNVIRNLWYKSSIDYEEEQILPLLNEVRSYHIFKAMQIDKATLESLEGKITAAQKPESPTLQSEGKTPKGWVKQMAEARDGFRKDLSTKEEDLKRKEEQLGIARTLIKTLKGQIGHLETENARLKGVIEALKVFVKTFQTDLAVINSKEDEYVKKYLDQLGLTDLLGLDLTATEEVKNLILAERLALSFVDD